VAPLDDTGHISVEGWRSKRALCFVHRLEDGVIVERGLLAHRAGGPGGQGVNTTDSAVQVLHIPSGTIVRCQDGRSQQKNKEKALQILRSRLLERKQREEAEKYAAQRKNQVGTGSRGEKMRTYNYPQNRVTDHRIGLTLYSLDRFLEGDLEEMLSTLQTADMENRLVEASESVDAPE
jgi:peptide chain release factor 1